MSDIEFIDGLMAKAPNPNAPTFVKAYISIKREDLITWLRARKEEWINADVKESKGGKWYVAVSTFKPKEGKPQSGKPAGGFEDDDLPF